MIEFRSEPLVARFLRPGGQELCEAVNEVRWDPLTGRTMRITAPGRPVTRPPATPEAIPETVLDRDNCPFCKDLAEVTPGIRPTLQSPRALKSGEATLFPNLYPYGTNSAVICLTREHHVPIQRFSRAQLRNGLAVARDYVAKVQAAEPEARYVNITWNLLPPSGGTLIHPHFQVNADHIPVNRLREDLTASARFKERTGSDYWRALIATERRLGTRFLADIGQSAWLVPFAPRGQMEVWGILPHRTKVADLTGAEMDSLAEGLQNILNGYARIGINSLNFAIETDESPPELLPVRLRVVARSIFRAWYRSDQTHFTVVLDEFTTIRAPEMTAANLRSDFDAPAGLEPERARA